MVKNRVFQEGLYSHQKSIFGHSHLCLRSNSFAAVNIIFTLTVSSIIKIDALWSMKIIEKQMHLQHCSLWVLSWRDLGSYSLNNYTDQTVSMTDLLLSTLDNPVSLCVHFRIDRWHCFNKMVPFTIQFEQHNILQCN